MPRWQTLDADMQSTQSLQAELQRVQPFLAAARVARRELGSIGNESVFHLSNISTPKAPIGAHIETHLLSPLANAAVDIGWPCGKRTPRTAPSRLI